MIYKIKKLRQAEKEIAKLTKVQQKALKDDFNIIESKGLESHISNLILGKYIREKVLAVDLRAVESG